MGQTMEHDLCTEEESESQNSELFRLFWAIQSFLSFQVNCFVRQLPSHFLTQATLTLLNISEVSPRALVYIGDIILH